MRPDELSEMPAHYADRFHRTLKRLLLKRGYFLLVHDDLENTLIDHARFEGEVLEIEVDPAKRFPFCKDFRITMTSYSTSKDSQAIWGFLKSSKDGSSFNCKKEIKKMVSSLPHCPWR